MSNIVHLKDVLVKKGYIRGPFGSALKRGEMKESGIPVYEQQNAIYDHREFRYFIDDDKYKTMERFTVKPGDLVVSCSGTVGKVTLIKDEDPIGIISQALLILRPDNSIILPEFLMYFFQTTKGYNSIIERSSGSVQVNIARREIIESIELKLPSIPEQRKIISVIDSFDKKVKTNKKICDNLQAQIDACFDELFIRNSDESWDEVFLKDFIFFQEGPGIRNWQYVEENGINFINIRCINNRDIDVSSASMISKEEAFGKYTHFLLEPYDIVMSCSGTLGRYAIVRKEHLPLCLNTSVIRFRPLLNEDDYSYVYAYMTSKEFYHHQLEMANGSAQQNFGPTHLKSIKLRIPPKEQRINFNNSFLPFIKEIVSIKAETKKVMEYRNAILPKLVFGEVDLSNIEIEG